MSLENLLKIGQLKEHPSSRAEIQKLLAAAARNLNDYIGTDLDEVSTKACIAEATRLLKDVKARLKTRHPELA